MTKGSVASGEAAGKGAFEFLRAAAERAMSSPEARSALSACPDFAAFEMATGRALREGASAGMSALLSALDAERAPLRCGECGGRMVRRSRPLSALWLLGRLRLVRGYWTCGCARGGRCPLDEELGVEGRAGTRATPALLRAAAPLAAADAAEDTEGAADAAAPSETMCCGIDGTGVPVRPGEASGRGRDGGAARTREAKIVAFRSGDGETTRRSAAIDSAASRDTDPEPSAFAARLDREAERAGFAAARVKVVLGDGAKWIWNVAAETFPGARQIVDIWHAMEHLWAVGRAVYGAETALCKAWSKKVCAALSDGRLDDVAAALRKLGNNDEARRCIAYVENNRDRMRYPEFRAAGLPVGSGMVESACDAVAGRLKRGGMRWSVERGANPILTLRCWWLDGRHDQFFEARAKPPPIALAA